MVRPISGSLQATLAPRVAARRYIGFAFYINPICRSRQTTPNRIMITVGILWALAHGPTKIQKFPFGPFMHMAVGVAKVQSHLANLRRATPPYKVELHQHMHEAYKRERTGECHTRAPPMPPASPRLASSRRDADCGNEPSRWLSFCCSGKFNESLINN